MEPPTGIEPASCGRRPQALAIGRRRRGGRGGDRTLALPLFRGPLSHLSYTTMVGMQRLERRVSCSQGRRGTTSPSSRSWTASDSNREPSPCKGVALPIGASSPWLPRPHQVYTGTARGSTFITALVRATPFRRGRAARCLNTLLSSQIRAHLGASAGGRSRTLSAGCGDQRRNRPLHPHRYAAVAQTKEPPRGGSPAGGSSGFRASMVLYPAASQGFACPFLDKTAMNGEYTRACVSSRLTADRSVTGGAP
jgi:hypothetical protein